jgi:TRAP-type mannitol/chloroaromatic compound transport system substrate-binding protein
MPAMAQNAPTIKWRLASSFPKSLDTMLRYGRVHRPSAWPKPPAASSRFRCSPAAKSFPGRRCFDAVKDGTVEMGHTAPTTSSARIPRTASKRRFPFGMTNRQIDAWYAPRQRYQADGRVLRQIEYRDHSLRQHRRPRWAAGIARKSRRSADLQGPEDAYRRLGRRRARQARRRAAADSRRRHLSGAGKGNDRRRRMDRSVRRPEARFQQGRQVLLLPGLVGRGSAGDAYINSKKWAELPKEYQTILQMACADAHVDMVAYDAKNPTALKQLVGSGRS